MHTSTATKQISKIILNSLLILIDVMADDKRPANNINSNTLPALNKNIVPKLIKMCIISPACF